MHMHTGLFSAMGKAFHKYRKRGAFAMGFLIWPLSEMLNYKKAKLFNITKMDAPL